MLGKMIKKKKATYAVLKHALEDALVQLGGLVHLHDDGLDLLLGKLAR